MWACPVAPADGTGVENRWDFSQFDLLNCLSINKRRSLYYYEFGRGLNGFRLYKRAPHKPGAWAYGVIREYKNRFGLNKICFPKNFRNKVLRKKQTSAYSFSSAFRTVSENNYDVAIFTGSDYEYMYLDQDVIGYKLESIEQMVRRVDKNG